MRTRSMLALVVSGMLAVGCGDAGKEAGAGGGTEGGTKVLKFTAIPGENKTELEAKFAPVAAHLSKELGVKVEYVTAADYPASVAMFKNGDVLLAWFGGLTGVQAREAVPGARAIAQGVEDPKFYSYFIAHESVDIEPSDAFPAAIADLPFTFSSASSTSGRLMPEYFIHQHSGKFAKDFFKIPVAFTDSHPNTVKAVQEGKIKVGAVSYTTYDSMKAEGKAEGTKILWKTPVYADYNFTAHPDLDKVYGAGFTDRMQKVILGMSGDLLLGFARKQLIAARNEDFDGIRQVAMELGLLR